MTTETKFTVGEYNELDCNPSLPTPGDWLGGIALFIALGVGVFIVGALQ